MICRYCTVCLYAAAEKLIKLSSLQTDASIRLFTGDCYSVIHSTKLSSRSCQLIWSRLAIFLVFTNSLGEYFACPPTNNDLLCKQIFLSEYRLIIYLLSIISVHAYNRSIKITKMAPSLMSHKLFRAHEPQRLEIAGLCLDLKEY